MTSFEYPTEDAFVDQVDLNPVSLITGDCTAAASPPRTAEQLSSGTGDKTRQKTERDLKTISDSEVGFNLKSAKPWTKTTISRSGAATFGRGFGAQNNGMRRENVSFQCSVFRNGQGVAASRTRVLSHGATERTAMRSSPVVGSDRAQIGLRAKSF